MSLITDTQAREIARELAHQHGDAEVPMTAISDAALEHLYEARPGEDTDYDALERIESRIQSYVDSYQHNA